MLRRSVSRSFLGPFATKITEEELAEHQLATEKFEHIHSHVAARAFTARKAGPTASSASNIPQPHSLTRVVAQPGNLEQPGEPDSGLSATESRSQDGNNYATDSSSSATFLDLPQRQWIKSPPNPLNTVATRKEWFRVMQYNTMVDSLTPFSKAKAYPPPPPMTIAESNPERSIADFTQQMHQSAISKLAKQWLGQKTQKIPNPEAAAAAEKEEDEKAAAATEEEEGQPKPPKFIFRDTTRVKPTDDTFTTEPVANVDFKVNEAHLQWNKARCPKILQEITHYDPDVIVMNEVNKVHFNTSLWKGLRSKGYGCTYTSARSRRPLRAFENTDPKAYDRHKGKRAFEDDIGNVVWYHKGRWFPDYTPGKESPEYVPYVNVTGLRDRITNLVLMLFVVQFTPGEDKAAIEARENEARALFSVINACTKESSERAHQSVMVLGDFNNCDTEEPCVNLMRDKYLSAYDIAGGPRWTTWYYTDKNFPWFSQRHLEEDYEKRHRLPVYNERKGTVKKVKELMASKAAEKRAEQLRLAGKKDATALQKEQEKKALEDSATQEARAASTDETDTAASTTEEKQHSAADSSKEVAEKTHASPSSSGSSSSSLPWIHSNVPKELAKLTEDARLRAEEVRQEDALEQRNMLQLREQGIIKRTQDYMFFQPQNLSTLQVLDVPSDAQVDQQSLLPNKRFPSHHVSLVADMCWNNFYPKDPTNVPWK